MSKNILLLFSMISLMFMGCSDSDGESPKVKVKGRPAVAVEVLEAKPIDMTSSINVVGTLLPRNEAEVRSEYSGIITNVYVTEWVRVKKGTQLAKLDVREANAALDAARTLVAQARVSENKARREYERALLLKDSGLITQQAFDDALTAREAAAAATASAGAQLNVAATKLSKALIVAPISGTISYRGVNVGDYIENMGSPKPMFRIVDNRLLDLTFTVPSSSMPDIRVGQAINFTTNAFPGKTCHGKIKYINPAVDPANRTVKVTAEVLNESEELRGGLFAKGEIVTEIRHNVLVVPRIALKTWDVANRQGEVFVASGQKAERRTIATGLIKGDLVEITSGIRPGELVITRGASNVIEGDSLKIVTAKEN